MKEQLLTYNGFKNNKFCFLDEHQKECLFTKCRNDLVKEFKLKQKESVKKTFNVKFFVSRTAAHETSIISDLRLA